MKRVIIAIVLIVVAILAIWFFMNRTDDTALPITDAESALRSIATDVVTIEQRLGALQPAAETGTLEPATAAEARAALEADLRDLVAAIAAIDAYTLTPEQRSALTQTLETLQAVFLRYQALLVAVDTTTGTSPSTASVDTESVTEQFVDALDRFADQVASTVRGYDVEPTPVQPATEQFLNELDAAVDAAEAALEPAPEPTDAPLDESVSASATLQGEAATDTPEVVDTPPTDMVDEVPSAAPAY